MKKVLLAFALLFLRSLALSSGGQGTTRESAGGSGKVTISVGGSGTISENKSLVYDAPTNFSISFTSQTLSSGTWTGILAPAATSYTLQYSTASNFTGTIYSSDTLNTFATVSGLTHSTLYYARARANPDGKYSNSSSTTTPAAGGTPFTLTKVSAKARTSGSGSTADIVLSSPAANSLITVQAGVGSTFSGVADNRGNSFTLAKRQPGTAGEAGIYYFVSTATYNGSYVITVTASGSVPITASAAEFSTPGASPLDVSTGTVGTSTTPGTGTSPTTASNCSLAVGVFFNNSGSNTPIGDPSGWGLLHEEGDGVNWLVSGAHFSTGTVLNSTTVNPSWTHSSADWAACVATFKN